MARGWESKSIESQMETAESRRAERNAPALSPEQIHAAREREGLQLSMTRVRKDLEDASHPRRREQLEAALRHLEQKLQNLG